MSRATGTRAADYFEGYERGKREEQERVYANFKRWESRMTPDERGAVLNVLLASDERPPDEVLERLRKLYEESK